ncbi:hypothetical protein Pmani_007884 [Petrolisthes manimaculis]|uniref:Uncharacterized protein n=1 Tax=Petrolisthes manimaculis TaxID=1843537 RepID=A0AAE1Q7H4_9EUCA|nr:hypothetical protein Pmani_007884 [Petrolisthes manimaculis]
MWRQSWRDSVRGSKTVKDVTAAIIPGIANIIIVAVSTAVATAIKDYTNKLVSNSAEKQRSCLLSRFDNDRLEQSEIFGIEEEPDEDEDIIQAKVIEVAADIGVKIEANDISIAYRLGREGGQGRPVLVRFCHRKNRNAVLNKKKELKKKQKKIYINEDLTPLRAAMLKIVKEQATVRNVTTRDGKIIAWLIDRERPVDINTPDDLHKVGITSPDWKRLKLDYLIQ